MHDGEEDDLRTTSTKDNKYVLQLENRLKKSEASLAFVKRDQEKILAGLHEEIETLTRKCSDLQFQNAMQAESVAKEQTLKEQLKLLQDKIELQNSRILELEEENQERENKEKETSEQRIWEKLQLTNQIESLERQLAEKEERLHELKRQVVVDIDVAKLQARVSQLYQAGNIVNQERISEISKRARDPGNWTEPQSDQDANSKADVSLKNRRDDVGKSVLKQSLESHEANNNGQVLKPLAEAEPVTASPPTSLTILSNTGHHPHHQPQQPRSLSSLSHIYSNKGQQLKHLPKAPATAPAELLHQQPKAASLTSLGASHSSSTGFGGIGSEQRSKLFRHHLRRSDHSANTSVILGPVAGSSTAAAHHLYTHANPPVSLLASFSGGSRAGDAAAGPSQRELLLMMNGSGQTNGNHHHNGAGYSGTGEANVLPPDYRATVATLPPIGGSVISLSPRDMAAENGGRRHDPAIPDMQHEQPEYEC